MKPQNTQIQIPKPRLVGLEAVDSFFTEALERLEHVVMRELRREGKRVFALVADHYSRRHHLVIGSRGRGNQGHGLDKGG